MVKKNVIATFFVSLVFGWLTPARAQTPHTLWQIGTKDNNTAEFALAPADGVAKYESLFKDDATYVVGRSDPAHDWPYIQPGPADAWAGGRSHTFNILFGIKTAPAEGTCRLVLDLVDTQHQFPPQLFVAINGKDLPARDLPAGASDASVNGHPEAGHHCTIDIPFAANLLQDGANHITIKNANGSWLLYDALHLETAAELQLAPLTGMQMIGASASAERSLYGTLAAPQQKLLLNVMSFDAEQTGVLTINNGAAANVTIKPGANHLEALVPAVDKPTDCTAALQVGGKVVGTQTLALEPIRKWVVYILAHSHHDLGYTDVQPHIVTKQMNNLEKAIELARATQNNPPGSRYKWNAEVSWSIDDYLRQRPEKAQQLFDAIKAGWIHVEGLYGDELTGLCRPEELLQLTRLAATLSAKTGVPVDSAMISDAPGLTWGVVNALSHAGIRYLSEGPNPGDRQGASLAAWQDKPFYWVSSSGKEKILVWTAFKGYAASHMWGTLTNPNAMGHLISRLEELEKKDYPYDMVQMRWSGFGDNAVPDESLPNAVKAWNQTHVYPHLIIATTTEAFAALEQQYASKIPTLTGDFTPYWEDGAGSSAAETALTRVASERLTQAQTLWALREPAKYPAADFADAWRNVLLYNEHTWGAYNSISSPDSQFVKDQWKIKQDFALDANRQSQKLVDTAVAGNAAPISNTIDVFNTTNWARTEVVCIAKELSAAGDTVKDSAGNMVPAQRLSTGELAFRAKDVPPFAAARYTISAGQGTAQGAAAAHDLVLSNDLLSVKLNPATGAIAELRVKGRDANLVDEKAPTAVNDYFYLPGGDLKGLQHNGTPKITVKEAGPLVAALLIESDAPGCNKLTREVRLYDGQPRIDLINTLDKQRIRAVEGGHIGFAFNVPEGQMRLEIPFAVMRPGIDQLPAACKNWLSVDRWADVSNKDFGVTWVTLDAPEVEVGGITANIPRSQPDPYRNWRQTIEPTQTLYSWIFNNHWHTNYKADQEGLITFRYSICPHDAYDPVAAAHFGTQCTQPLLAAPARGALTSTPRLTVEPADVVVTAFKPTDDGKGLIVRLFGASGQDRQVQLHWSAPAPTKMYRTDISEKPGTLIEGPISVGGWQLISIRAEI